MGFNSAYEPSQMTSIKYGYESRDLASREVSLAPLGLGGAAPRATG